MKDGGPRPISQHISLQEAFSDGSPVISSFTGTIPVLNDLQDRSEWRQSANGEYSAGSVYKILITARKIKWGFVEIWKASAPSKVKIFSLLLLKYRLLAREMLNRRGMNCEVHCVMCDDGAVETANHLFFHCRNAMEVWSQFANFMINGDTVEDTWEASSSYYCGNSGTLRHVWITNFMAVLWSLWRQHNEVIFRGKKYHLGQLQTVQKMMGDCGKGSVGKGIEL